MRFLGKLRHYIAVKTGTKDVQKFGSFVADISDNPDARGLTNDLMYGFFNWYKYYTKDVLGNEFAYPFDELPSHILQQKSIFPPPPEYFQKIAKNSDEVVRLFREKYEDYIILESPQNLAVMGAPYGHFILHPTVPVWFPCFMVYHAQYSPKYFDQLVPLLHQACADPTLGNVSRLCYFINVRSFYLRGQAAITLWILDALFALRGKKLQLDTNMEHVVPAA